MALYDIFQAWQNSKNASFRGPAGVSFVFLILATVFAVVGFTTPAWSVQGTHHEGLFHSCVCATNNNDPPHWFIFIQVSSVVCFFGMCIVFYLTWDHFYGTRMSKNVTAVSMVILSFINVIILVVAYSIYGTKRNGLDWSYGLSVSGGCLFLIASILGVFQLVCLKSDSSEETFIDDFRNNHVTAIN